MNLGYHTWNQETRLAGLGSVGSTAWSLLSLASFAASAYHGSKRHGGSIGWGVAWGALGALFPVITPAIAAGQGFADCKYDCRGR